jgi:transposase
LEYTDFKRLAVALTLHPDILTLDVAERLGIHPVMLYRWRMEMRNGDLPKKTEIDNIESEVDLVLANRKIKNLEKKLKEATRERDFLKKAKRFFQQPKKKSLNS